MSRWRGIFGSVGDEVWPVGWELDADSEVFQQIEQCLRVRR